jgi:hypothetical protein
MQMSVGDHSPALLHGMLQEPQVGAFYATRNPRLLQYLRQWAWVVADIATPL